MKRLNQYFKISLAIIASVLLASCEEIEFKDGKIPKEFRTIAKKLTGVYVGHIDKRDGELKLQLVGDLAVLSYKNSDGIDIVGKNCGSKIGRLIKGKINDDKEVESLIFSFDPGSCDLPAKEIKLEFESAYNKIIVNLLDHEYLDRQCVWNDHGRNPPTAPIYECRNVIRKNNIRGAFFRRNVSK